MPDPITGPVFQEDTVHTGDEQQPRVGMPASRRKSQEEAWQAKRDRENAELSKVLATEEGQAVIMRILNDCHIYSPEMLTDADQGRRILGVKIVRQIVSLSPDAWPDMLANDFRRQARLKEAEDSTHANL